MKSKVFNDTHHPPLVSRVYVCFRISKLLLVSITVFNAVRILLNLDSKTRDSVGITRADNNNEHMESFSFYRHNLSKPI